jgi:hypothetical protein
MNKFQVLRLIMASNNVKLVVLNIILTGGQQLTAKQYSDAAARLTVTRNILSEIVMLVFS